MECSDVSDANDVNEVTNDKFKTSSWADETEITGCEFVSTERIKYSDKVKKNNPLLLGGNESDFEARLKKLETEMRVLNAERNTDTIRYDDHDRDHDDDDDVFLTMRVSENNVTINDKSNDFSVICGKQRTFLKYLQKKHSVDITVPLPSAKDKTLYICGNSFRNRLSAASHITYLLCNVHTYKNG